MAISFIRFICPEGAMWRNLCEIKKVKVKVIVKVKMIMEKKQRALEIVVKIVVAALTAFLTALGTTSCMRGLM